MLLTIRTLCLFLTPRSSRLVASLLAVALVGAGCASAPRYDVTVFHEWPAAATREFRLTPPADDASIKARSFRQSVTDAMVQAGFTPNESAALVVDFDYQVKSREVRYADPSPFGLYHPYLGLGYHRSGVGLSVHTPLWWQYDHVRIQRITEHALMLNITDTSGEKPVRVFEGASAGRTVPDAGSILKQLLSAVLADFPGPSGQTRQVTVEPTEPKKPSK